MLVLVAGIWRSNDKDVWKIVRGKRISESWWFGCEPNNTYIINSMDSIVRSCKILVPQLLAGRLILDGYYCVFVL